MSAVLTTESVRLPGPQGVLAGELAYAGQPTFSCLLINPHPHMGGSMRNNLIAHLAEALADAGGATLRFDYSGVGESEGLETDVAASLATFWATGHAPEDPRRITDATAALAWLRAAAPLPLVVVGYSFGAFVANRITPADASALILISPTLKQHDFNDADHQHIPQLVIYSDNDFATPFHVTEQWADSLRPPAARKLIVGGEHFFKTREPQVAEACGRFLGGRLS